MIFALVSVVSVTVVLVVYAQVPTLLGYGQNIVRLQVSDAAGLYVGSRVTYNGVMIGRVTEVNARPDGAEATLSVSDEHRIPEDVRAEVHSVSAIGEQYVDLVPQSKSPTSYLADGATIPQERSSVPVPTGALVDNVNSLLASVPQDALAASLQELSDAFSDTGPALRRILRNADQLIDIAQENLEPTKRLVADAAPLLKTQTASSPQIRSFVRSLAKFSESVRGDDKRIRSLIDRGAPAAAEVDRLFQQLRPTLPILLSNLIGVEEVLVTYNPALESILVTYPALTTALISATAPHQDDQALAIDFRLTAMNPPPCTVGFLPPEKQRHPDDLSRVETPDDLYCKLPHDDPTEVRGVRNIPCLTAPGRRAATIEECGGEGFKPIQQHNRAFPKDGLLGAVTSTLYDPETGTGLLADGQLFQLGGIGSEARKKEDRTWQRMLLAPVGR